MPVVALPASTLVGFALLPLSGLLLPFLGCGVTVVFVPVVALPVSTLVGFLALSFFLVSIFESL